MEEINRIESNEVEKELRQHVTTNYPEKPYGKLSHVVEEALKEWFKGINRSVHNRILSSLHRMKNAVKIVGCSFRFW